MGKLGRKPNRLSIVNYYEARSGLTWQTSARLKGDPQGVQRGVARALSKWHLFDRIFGCVVVVLCWWWRRLRVWFGQRLDFFW